MMVKKGDVVINLNSVSSIQKRSRSIVFFVQEQESLTFEYSYERKVVQDFEKILASLYSCNKFLDLDVVE